MEYTINSLFDLLVSMKGNGDFTSDLQVELIMDSLLNNNEVDDEILKIYPFKIYKKIDIDIVAINELEKYANNENAKTKLLTFKSFLENLSKKYDLIKEIELLQDNERIYYYKEFSYRLSSIYAREIERLEKFPDNLEAKDLIGVLVNELKEDAGITKKNNKKLERSK